MRRGFTLIEIIVAVGLLGLMASLIFGVISSMFGIQRDMDDLVEVNHMGRVALDRISKDVSQAFLSMNLGPEDQQRTLFLGERDRLVFSYMGNVPVKAGVLETDQGVVEYKLGGRSKDREGKNLVRRFKAVIDGDAERGGDEYVMATGIKKLKFEYWDKQKEDWDDSWRADDPFTAEEPGFSLPTRVRIYLEMWDRRGEEYVFETQTAIYVRNPIRFGKLTNEKAAQAQGAKDLKKGKLPSGALPPGGLPPGGLPAGIPGAASPAGGGR